MNQHPGKAQDDDLSKLQDVIQQADKTLLAMDGNGQVRRGMATAQRSMCCAARVRGGAGAVSDPVGGDDGAQVLRRVWCLFEIFKTVSRKGVANLIVLAHEVNLMGLKDIFIKLDVAGARAWGRGRDMPRQAGTVLSVT